MPSRHFLPAAISMMALVTTTAFLPALARGDIYVTFDPVINGNNVPGWIGEYTNGGIPINANLVSDLNRPEGIALSGTSLYVATYAAGAIGKYVLGATPGTIDFPSSSPSLVSGLVGPIGVVVSNSELFVGLTGGSASSGTVRKYTTDGVPINTSFPGSGMATPNGIAVSGDNVFVADYVSTNPTFHGEVFEFTTSGVSVPSPTFIDGSLMAGFSNPTGIAISGSNLYVANNATGTIDEFTLGGTPGTIVSSRPSLITGLNGPGGIAVLGSHLYVTNYGSGSDGSVGEYDLTTGNAINASLISGLNRPAFIVVTADVPEPASLSFLSIGLAALLRRRGRAVQKTRQSCPTQTRNRAGRGR